MRVISLVLRTAKLFATVRFYRALGVPLMEIPAVDPEAGVHYEGTSDGIQWAVHAAPEGDTPDRLLGGALVPGFAVPDLTAALSLVREAGGLIVVAPSAGSDGHARAVVLDPEGRALELLEL